MDISQISIHLKDGEERTNEISLLQPLEERSLRPKKKPKPSFFWFLGLKDKLIYFFMPKLSAEEKFKTQLAHLLSQDLIREHYLEDAQRREAFFNALQQAAHQIGYTHFARPAPTLSAEGCAHFLTKVNGLSLLEQPGKLASCVKRMRQDEQPILDSILSQIERSPLFSGLEIYGPNTEATVSLATHYSRFRVLKVEETGKVNYELFKNRAAPATQTESTANQGIVLDTTIADDPTWIGSYCGDLGTPSKVLEQVLLILQAQGEVRVVDEPSPLKAKILFTSLLNWRELEDVCRQRDAIRALDGQTLQIGSERVTLQLFYYNLNSIHRIPIPAETRAFLEDLNDECIMRLLEIHSFENLPEDFFERQKIVLGAIDAYRANRPHFEDPVFNALVHKRRIDGRSLRGMDALLYLEEASKRLGIFHNKNCRNGVDRTTTAKAADKAQNAIKRVAKECYLPGGNEYKKLFRVLYSLYLIGEEPEINATLTMGLGGKSFYKRLFYHNPQQEDYLTSWAKVI